jgi:hypothetical protein
MMRHARLSALTTALALTVSSAAVLAQQPAPAAPADPINVCEELVTFLERRGNAQPASPVTLDQARQFQRVNNVAACRDGFVRIRTAGITLRERDRADLRTLLAMCGLHTHACTVL